LWIVAFLVFLAALPALLSKFLDPLNAKRIRAYCSDVGVTEVQIRPFPNHYGVRFTKNGRKHYARCVVTMGAIRWKGLSPAEVE
jgi:hypothetical protein